MGFSTGLYIEELCLTGLVRFAIPRIISQPKLVEQFFLARNSQGKVSCLPQAICMFLHCLSRQNDMTDFVHPVMVRSYSWAVDAFIDVCTLQIILIVITLFYHL